MRKISIRVNIIVLFSVLVVSICTCIISVSYYVGYDSLIKSSTNLLEALSDRIEVQVSDFLRTHQTVVALNAQLVQEGLLPASDKDKMLRRFLQISKDYPYSNGAIFGDQAGNFIYLERVSSKTFELHTNSGANERADNLDQNGNFVGIPSYLPDKLYPPDRPWYISASEKKKNIVSDPFVYYYDRAKLLVVVASPIYKRDGSLFGVLGLPIMLNHLSSFLASLTLTPNSHILVIDNKDHVIAAKELQHFIGEQFPTIKSIKLDSPWIYEAVDQYRVSKKHSFFFLFNGIKYLSYFKTVQVDVDSPWTIVIVLPFNDLAGSLNANLLMSIIIAITILALGLILVWFASNSISRPIVALARQVNTIKDMDLTEESVMPSTNIQEIYNMQNAFAAMKKSLKSFIRYVPFSLVKRLLTTGDVAHVGGESKVVTIMFTDIEGFTTISEKMSPNQLTSYLSQYFEAMTVIILKNMGTVDKYIGDGIMAFWGAPLEDEKHALNACKSAEQMLEAVKDLNAKWQKEYQPTITIRIGIVTGKVIIGNVGSEDKLNYTAIGDDVNLSSRLQGSNKFYKSQIIVNQSTYDAVKNDFAFRLLDRVRVKGKKHDVYVYELLARDHLIKDLEKYNVLFGKAFGIYQTGGFDQALTLFQELALSYPTDHLAAIYVERCQYLLKNPPILWEGIWDLSIIA